MLYLIGGLGVMVIVSTVLGVELYKSDKKRSIECRLKNEYYEKADDLDFKLNGIFHSGGIKLEKKKLEKRVKTLEELIEANKDEVRTCREREDAVSDKHSELQNAVWKVIPSLHKYLKYSDTYLTDEDVLEIMNILRVGDKEDSLTMIEVQAENKIAKNGGWWSKCGTWEEK